MQNNNLDTLKILFIIKGIINLLSTLFVIVMILGLGAFLTADIPANYETRPNELPFNPITIISSLGIFAVIVSIAYTVVTFLAAKYIGERKNHTFIVIVSVLNMFSGILGIGLGVFALIELHNDNVKPLFGRGITEKEQFL